MFRLQNPIKKINKIINLYIYKFIFVQHLYLIIFYNIQGFFQNESPWRWGEVG